MFARLLFFVRPHVENSGTWMMRFDDWQTCQLTDLTFSGLRFFAQKRDNSQVGQQRKQIFDVRKRLLNIITINRADTSFVAYISGDDIPYQSIAASNARFL